MDKRNPNYRQYQIAPYKTAASAVTVMNGDAFKAFVSTFAGTATYSLPQALPGSGPFYFQVLSSSNIIKLSAAGSDNIAGLGTTYTLPGLANASLGLVCIIAGYWTPVTMLGSVINGSTLITGGGSGPALTVQDTGSGSAGTLVVIPTDGSNAIWVQDPGSTSGVSIQMSYAANATQAGGIGFGPGGLLAGSAITDFGMYSFGALKLIVGSHVAVTISTAGNVNIATASSGATLGVSAAAGIGIDIGFGSTGGLIGVQCDSSASSGCAFFDNNSTLGRNALVMNSSGADFGTVYNNSAQQWSLGFSASTTATGTAVFTWTASSQIGFFGVTPSVRITGYGTPTGGSHQGSFAAGTITLPNLAAAVAQLIIDLKTYGLLGT